jgi:hypothetical protein
MSPTSPLLTIAGLAIFLAILGIAAQTQFGLFNGGASGSAAEAAFTQELSPGDVLHIYVESYRRYGPKFSQIVDGSGIPTEASRGRHGGKLEMISPFTDRWHALLMPAERLFRNCVTRTGQSEV